ncbi:MAG: DoxX family membrane protein [Betaproteobacteria bacterium]|nr:DoxX family membrane protein [Betaproteobacteria bacterium]
MGSLPLLDPVAASAMCAFLAVIFLTGAWQKLRDLSLFQANIDNYRLLPDGLAWPVAIVLPMWELAAGVLVLFDSTRTAGAALAIGLLLVVTAAVVTNLMRGRTEIDCGCGSLGGHVGDQTLNWGLTVRNALLALAALLALREDAARALVWIDYLSVAGGTLGLLGLYVTANQLMANHPRLHTLRNH